MSLTGSKMKTLFRELLGDSPQVKVIDFFIDNYLINNGWSLVEIKKETSTGYSTLKKLVPKLVKKKILVVDKKIGHIKLYKLNLKSEAVKKLISLDWQLVKQEVEK